MILSTPLERAVAAIKQSPMYIGSPTIMERVKWHAMKGFSTLVRLDVPKDCIEEAELEGIAQIDESDFRLYICGNWHEKWDSPFHNVKSRGRLVKSSRHEELLTNIWEEITNGVQHIQESNRMKNSHVGHTILKDNGIVIRHQVFEVCSFVVRVRVDTDIVPAAEQ